MKKNVKNSQPLYPHSPPKEETSNTLKASVTITMSSTVTSATLPYHQQFPLKRVVSEPATPATHISTSVENKIRFTINVKLPQFLFDTEKITYHKWIITNT